MAARRGEGEARLRLAPASDAGRQEVEQNEVQNLTSFHDSSHSWVGSLCTNKQHREDHILPTIEIRRVCENAIPLHRW